MKLNQPFLIIKFLLIIGIIVSSCVKNSIIQNEPEPVGIFDYATTKDCALELNYNLPKGYDVVFSIFIESPYDENGIKKTNLSPMFKAMTENGKFISSVYGTTLRIPAYVKEVYICSDNIGVVSEIVVPVSDNNTIVMDCTDIKSAQSYPLTKASYNGVSSGIKTLGSWNENALPDYLIERKELPIALINDIDYSIRRSRSIEQYYPEFLAKGVVLDANIVLPTSLEVSFVTASATISSAFAYFTYPTGSKPKTISEIDTKIVILPCTIKGVKRGDRVRLQYWNGTAFQEQFPAGVSVGWILLGNSYKNNSITEVPLMNQFSISEFNREVNEANKQHVLQLYSAREDIYVIAIEDQNRESVVANNDFSDVIVLVQSTVRNAIDPIDVVKLKDWVDTDGDGVHDNDDEMPNNPNVAFAIDYPAGAELGTLAFEDLWPSKGDYDMNDMVVTYHSTHFVNRNNFISIVKDYFSIIHSGATMDNGFGYQYGVNANKIKTITKTSTHVGGSMEPFKIDAKGLEIGQNLATIILCNNVNEALGYNSGKTIDFIVETEFSVPQKIIEVTLPPYNPFIIPQSGKGQRSREVHLPGYKPTTLIDKTLLGTNDDKSDLLKGLFYISSEKYPFALHIPGKFNYPQEKKRIDDVFPYFNAWVSSNGAEHADWYKK